MAEQQAKLDVLTANAQRILAQVEQIKAQAINYKVEAVFAAMQAGGVATERPQIAPAGDEILRSAGWKDATPAPDLRDLDQQPVQAGGLLPQEPESAVSDDIASLQPQTGHGGQAAGIETAAIE